MATALSVFGVMPASATPIPLGGYAGPLTIKFTNYESFTIPPTAAGPVPGSQNFGIFEITSASDANGNLLYQAPIIPNASNPLIVGVFSGITVTANTGTHTYNSGGMFSLYDDTNSAFGPISTQGPGVFTAGCVSGCYPGITNMGYDNILNLMLVPGASAGTPPLVPDPLALASTLYTTLTSTNPLTGFAQGYADINATNPGSDAGQFQTGTQVTALGTPADFFIKDSFCGSGANQCSGPGTTGFELRSEDPISTDVVPEPGSLVLLGTGLLGFGVFYRRQQKRKDRSA